MSRLIAIDPQTKGYEFGYYTFDSLPAIEVANIGTSQDTSSDNGMDSMKKLRLPLTDNML